jgi:RNA polymerase sigma factor (sigma-70 family)
MNVPLAAEELALLDEIAAGVRDTSILEDRYKPRLLWFARMMGVPPEDSADLVQDVFLIAIRDIRGARFRRDSTIITWLDGILKNKIKDFWRARTRHRALFTSIESSMDDSRASDSYIVRSPGRWDEDIDVRGVLGRMPGELRVILLLNATDGLTVDEISRKLKKRPGTVGRKLAEARKLLRQRLLEARVGDGRRNEETPAALTAAAGR